MELTYKEVVMLIDLIEDLKILCKTHSINGITEDEARLLIKLYAHKSTEDSQD